MTITSTFSNLLQILKLEKEHIINIYRANNNSLVKILILLHLLTSLFLFQRLFLTNFGGACVDPIHILNASPDSTCLTCDRTNRAVLLDHLLDTHDWVQGYKGSMVGWPCLKSGRMQHPLSKLCCCGQTRDETVAEVLYGVTDRLTDDVDGSLQVVIDDLEEPGDGPVERFSVSAAFTILGEEAVEVFNACLNSLSPQGVEFGMASCGEFTPIGKTYVFRDCKSENCRDSISHDDGGYFAPVVVAEASVGGSSPVLPPEEELEEPADKMDEQGQDESVEVIEDMTTEGETDKDITDGVSKEGQGEGDRKGEKRKTRKRKTSGPTLVTVPRFLEMGHPSVCPL